MSYISMLDDLMLYFVFKELFNFSYFMKFKFQLLHDQCIKYKTE